MTNIKNKNKIEKKDFFKFFTTKQIVWFVIGSVLFVVGIIFDVFDIIGRSLNIQPSKNPLLKADASLRALFGNKPLGFLFFGIVLLLVGTLIIATSLSLASKNEDREKERLARKEQRLKKMKEVEKPEVIQASTVQEAPGTINLDNKQKM